MLKTIKLNMTDKAVAIAQYLTEYVKIGKATEIFDDKFKEHVITWQKNHSLDADGIIGKNTWKAMAKNAPTCSTSKNKKSVYTCAIQMLIGGITVDGDYGSKTKKAVAAYQSAAGLNADGICGPKTWMSLITETTSSTSTPTEETTSDNKKVLNDCVKYLQWDKKWKNVKYSTHTSSQTIGNSGCGPSSMAMVVATFIDPSITPVEMCALAVKKGYRTYDNGTSWGFFKYVFKQYSGFEKYVETSSVETLKAALREGALAVCSMNSNDNHFWTSSGHFITARGCDNTYIYANDPNKSETPRKQAASKFKSCLKQAFIFWPKKQEPIKDDESQDEEKTYNLDGEIIDISKWQGDINFNALKPKVSLVIARGSSSTNKDIKIDTYAAKMNELNIPFGVYCYSYADTKEKAINEAQKLVQYTEKYSPLFYILDAEEADLTNETIEAFVKKMRKLTKSRVGCYVAHNRYKKYDYDSIRDLFDFTWIPRYGKNDGTVAGAIKPAYKCDLWQYTSTGKIAGISGNVDKNIITNDGHNLKWFLNI